MERLKRLGKDSQSGFVLVEVMMGMTVILLLSSSLLSVSRMEYRRALMRVQRKETYYASLAAVRLAAAGVISGEWEGMEEMFDTELVFVSADGEKEIRFPVRIRCRDDGDTMLLSAWAGIGEKEEGISLTLRSDGGTWIPVRYAFDWQKEEDAV